MANQRNNGTSLLELMANKARGLAIKVKDAAKQIADSIATEYCEYFDDKKIKCTQNPNHYCKNPADFENCEVYKSIKNLPNSKPYQYQNSQTRQTP